MKVIDLLNKIANGEQVPEYVKYYNRLEKKVYIMIVCKENLFYKLDQLEIQLNSRVEEIEEPQEHKIPEKLENEKEFYAYTRYEENKDEIDKVLYILKALNLAEEKIDNLNNKINEIIDCLEEIE